jgi:hypothetical protein
MKSLCEKCIHNGLCIFNYNELLKEFEYTDECKMFHDKLSRGEWIDEPDEGIWITRCSNCGISEPQHKHTPYCHNCGAQMKIK